MTRANTIKEATVYREDNMRRIAARIGDKDDGDTLLMNGSQYGD